MTQLSFWGPEDAPTPKLTAPGSVPLRLLITVKAAPEPSARYGETVCVGALSVDPRRRGWIRLYPITVEDHLKAESARRGYLDPYVEDSLCELIVRARDSADARSIALIRVADIAALKIHRHPGWSPEQHKKISAYLNQRDILGDHQRGPLQAPRFTGFYHYRCADRRCRGHVQRLRDSEFVARQRHLGRLSDAEAVEQLTTTFLTRLCSADRDVAFYVGNQARRPQTFSVGGVYAPRHPRTRNRLDPQR
ncbi:hypothetical protein GA0074692_2654 [Micromonospora pallida]|uniref:Uncharacterized protein n=1 Tax=Micromonospora pallida TaxID=145854 RepID=A0A1C6SI25_9ACTN|nr:hypothetical protein [Micromonospora pallida]SCL29052.1 hypothetical protein GA0074692_2654 [Micromonospora pallida]